MNIKACEVGTKEKRKYFKNTVVHPAQSTLHASQTNRKHPGPLTARHTRNTAAVSGQK
jgi:hypothetical protein